MSTKQILCHVEMLAKALVLIFLEQLLNGDHAIKEKKWTDYVFMLLLEGLFKDHSLSS